MPLGVHSNGYGPSAHRYVVRYVPSMDLMMCHHYCKYHIDRYFVLVCRIAHCRIDQTAAKQSSPKVNEEAATHEHIDPAAKGCINQNNELPQHCRR